MLLVAITAGRLGCALAAPAAAESVGFSLYLTSMTSKFHPQRPLGVAGGVAGAYRELDGVAEARQA
jgi:hypothetical protein